MKDEMFDSGSDKSSERLHTYELYRHLQSGAQLEGIFSSLRGIDNYMDWRKGHAQAVERRGYAQGDLYSITEGVEDAT